MGALLWYVSGELPSFWWVAVLSLALVGIAAGGVRQLRVARKRVPVLGGQVSMDHALETFCDLLRRSPSWPVDPGG